VRLQLYTIDECGVIAATSELLDDEFRLDRKDTRDIEEQGWLEIDDDELSRKLKVDGTIVNKSLERFWLAEFGHVAQQSRSLAEDCTRAFTSLPNGPA
jgi:hypothetical protein